MIPCVLCGPKTTHHRGHGGSQRKTISFCGELLQQHSTYKIGNAGDVVIAAPLVEAVHNLLGGAGIPIAGGSDLNRGGAGQHEFNDIGGR